METNPDDTLDVMYWEMFSKWLQSLDHILPGDDDESSKRLRSFLVSFKMTWPDELNIKSLWKQELQLSVFEVEAKIQQTRRLIAGNLHMLSSLQYKPFWNFSESTDFFNSLDLLMKYSPYNDDVLDGKLSFIRECIRGVDSEKYVDEKPLPIQNFIRDFANTAVFLTCLYWIKQEADEEITTERNNLIFDWMQKHISWVFDIVPLYIDILKSSALDRVIEAVDASVDFFFGHLRTVIFKDDFVILRNRLLFLFTFLFSDPSPPPCEDADETRAIRNQFYTLLLPFDDETEKDLSISDKMMVLHDFMIKIEMPAAKAKQLYYGSPDPRLKLEIEQIVYTCFVSVHKELNWIDDYLFSWDGPEIHQMQLYGMELRCLRVFLLCFATWDDSDQDINLRLRSLILSFQDIWEKEEEACGFARRLHAIHSKDIWGTRARTQTWHQLASELKEKIQLSKLQIKKSWVNSVYCSPLTSYEN